LTRVLTNGEALADALSLFRASPSHSKYNVNDIYTYLQLPLQYKTIELYYEGDKPVGLITWCWLKKEDADLFLVGQYHPNPDDYRLDDPLSRELWGMEFIAPYGHTKQMMRSIKHKIEERYGPQNVHWRRFHSRDTRRTKRFKV
jgi:hemolysin-activating ACP:hemolysin acyltransferase